MKFDKNNIPKEVVDVEAYEKFLELQNSIDFASDRYYQTSDPKLKVDLMCVPSILRRQMRHLPSGEIESIIEKTTKFRTLLSYRRVEEVKAFGLNISKDKTLNNSVLEIKKAEILDYFGRYFKPTEVHRIIMEDWGYKSIPYNQVRDFFKANQDTINELQNNYRASYSNVRLGLKRSRLDELSWLYEDRKKRYGTNPTQSEANLLKGLLESIKREVEGDLVLNAKVQVDIQQTINFQLQNELMKDLNVTKLVLSRLAGIENINQMMLLSRLSNSFYSKFTGFRVADKDRFTDEIPYPSGVLYELDRIAEKTEEIEKNDNVLKTLPIITEERKNEVLSLKDKLLKELKSKREIVVSTEHNINKYEQQVDLELNNED